jgi:coenzyme F420 hydrogenase subunit beta
MIFELLEKEIINVGLCQGCALCVGLCKHIEMEDTRPKLKDYCILEREGQDCGKCYQSCPQVNQKVFETKEPLGIYSLRSKDPEILARASSGGFVSTITRELLENQTLSEIVMVQGSDDKPLDGGVVYKRSGVLKRLVDLTGETFDPVGIVGVPCEMRGAAKIEEDMNREILKIGLFCSSQIFPEKRCGCTLLGEANLLPIGELKKFIEEWEQENQYHTHEEGKRCDSCKQYCSHCQDFPAIYSDITAGEVGSQNGYTTVVAWTERGKNLVESAIAKELFEIGEASEEDLKAAINFKSKRELLTFEKPPRQKVLDYITNQGPTTISNMVKDLNLEPKKVRYEALRLTQKMLVEMKVEPEMDEPMFSLICE